MSEVYGQQAAIIRLYSLQASAGLGLSKSKGLPGLQIFITAAWCLCRGEGVEVFRRCMNINDINIVREFLFWLSVIVDRI